MREYIGLLLSFFALMITMTVSAFASDFTDMPNDWSKPALESAIENGLLNGDHGKILPKNNLTRAQMATILNRAFASTKEADLSDYTDVSADVWYYSDMSKAVQMKTFMGSNNKLNPDSNITREEVFVVLDRAFKLSHGSEHALDHFSDKELVSSWAKNGVESLVAAGYVSGSDGKLNPKQNITRAEFAQIMDNLLKNYIKDSGTYKKDLNGNVIITVPDVTLKNLTITGDLIIGDGVGDGDITLDSITVTGRTVIRGGGVNSVEIIGNSKLKNIFVARVDGEVRVYTEDGVEAGDVIVDGSDNVIIEGDLENVTITAPNITVTATNAQIESAEIKGEESILIVASNTIMKKATVDAPKSEIRVLKGSQIEDISIQSDGVNITGNGSVETVEANADNIEVTTRGTTVTAGSGTTGVKAGSEIVRAGSSKKTNNPTPSSSSGGSGGSGSSSVKKVNLTDYNAALAAVIESDYTSESWAEYQAVVKVNIVTTVNSQKEVDSATKIIQEAQKKLVSVIDAAISPYNTTLSAVKENHYTTESWSVYQTVVSKNVVNKNNTLEEIQAATKSIQEAQKNLVFAVTITDEGVINGYQKTIPIDLEIPSKIGEIYITSIGKSAFFSCTGLNSVTIPEGVTSIGERAFFNCTGLSNVTIPEGVTSIGNSAFQACTGLSSVTIPESVTSIGVKAFSNCKGLSNVTIPVGVTNINDFAFDNCTGLSSVTIPEKVTSIGIYAFNNCTGLSSVTIPEKVTSIGNRAFYACTALSSVTIPEGVTSIGDSAFIDMDNFNKAYNNSAGTYTWDGTDWTKISGEIGEAEYSFYIENGILTGYEGTLPIDLVIPKNIGGITVTSIGNSAFSNCKGLSSVTIPEGVTSIGDSAFSSCTGLNSVTIPVGVTSIGNSAFSSCTGLSSVTIPEGVSNIGNSAFSSCTGLSNVTIPEGVTSIGNSAFYACKNLSSVTIPKGVTSIGDSAFSVCTGLSSVTIPESVTSIGKSAFYACTGLSNVTIPEGVTSVGNSAFYACKNLSSVTIPKGVTSIGDSAFYKCTGLSSVTIPEDVTSIGNYAFYACTGLSSITVPEGVTSIGNSAFVNETITNKLIEVSGEEGAGIYLYDGDIWTKEKKVISIQSIVGVTAPVVGETPVLSIEDTVEYTATIAWNGNPIEFVSNTPYTAIITVIPKEGYTLYSVPENFFSVTGAATKNDTGSGVVTAVFASAKASTIIDDIAFVEAFGVTDGLDENRAKLIFADGMKKIVTISTVEYYDIDEATPESGWIKVEGININQTVADAIEDNMVTFTEKDDEYSIKQIRADNDNGYDNFISDATTVTAATSDIDGVLNLNGAIYTISDDAVVFLNQNGDYSVITGAILKNLDADITGQSTVLSNQTNDGNIAEVVTFSINTDLPNERILKDNYCYVTDCYKGTFDGDNVMIIEVWNAEFGGKEILYEVGGDTVYNDGYILVYDLLADNKVENVEVVTKDNITGATVAEVGAITNVGKDDKGDFIDFTGSTTVTDCYYFTDNTQYIFCDTEDNKYFENNGAIAVADESSTGMIDNAFVLADSNKKVLLIVVDTNNNYQ